MDTPSSSHDPDVAARLRRSVTRMNRRLRQSALGGVSPAQASMLAVINARETPSLGELAIAEQIQPPSVTRMVRTLVEAGWVTTTDDEIDRRCTRVSLTEAGRREVADIRQRKNEFLVERIAQLPPDEQKNVLPLVELLEHLLGDA